MKSTRLSSCCGIGAGKMVPRHCVAKCDRCSHPHLKHGVAEGDISNPDGVCAVPNCSCHHFIPLGYDPRKIKLPNEVELLKDRIIELEDRLAEETRRRRELERSRPNNGL